MVWTPPGSFAASPVPRPPLLSLGSNGVRKARQDRPPGFVVHARESERISSNAGEKAVDRLAELLAKTGTSRLVPLARLQRFVFGLGPEDDSSPHGQPMSLERTSDQGTSESGFSTCSAQRRSNSARSASDSRSSASRSASLRLSHSAIASAARSPAGNLSRSGRGLEDMTRSSHGWALSRNWRAGLQHSPTEKPLMRNPIRDGRSRTRSTARFPLRRPHRRCRS